MSRLTGAFLLLCLYAGFAHGMDCNLGQKSKNFLEQTLKLDSCPGIFDSPSKSYCCIDVAKERTYCCDVEEFALKTGLGIIVPVIITVIILFSIILCCVCCLCCSCCPWYRRRHRGTVYGIQAPNVVQVVQTTPNVPPSYVNQENPAENHYVPYPTNPAGFPQHPPPQYTSEAYAKQAPYNPTYPPQ